ncbi:MAG TPA: hemerythrin domain-containing protein [Streptosporangiaceae bacterium]|nr:hemerythrin domain-containing protein [Streptosporangiaceae bacterium]
MPDVFEVLRTDHEQVKAMLEALESSPGSAQGASDPVLQARGELATRLVMESSKHEAAEEQYFWPVVREQVSDGDELASEAIRQEEEAKEILDKIEKLDASQAEFDELLAVLTPATRKHIEFEETKVWPLLRQALDARQVNELGGQVARAEELGPTRPHPGTPADPTVLKTAGTAAAMIDKLRDAATGRGSAN